MGDDSKNYQTFRKFQAKSSKIKRTHHLISIILGKERSQCGKNRGITVNRCKGTKETFGNLQSNGIGDPFIDAG